MSPGAPWPWQMGSWKTTVRKESGTRGIIEIRYLLIYSDVLPMFQRPDGATAAARIPLPLSEHLEVHAELAQALHVMTSAVRDWRSNQGDNLRSAMLRKAIGLRLVTTCRGLRSFGRRNSGLCHLLSCRPRAGITGSRG